MKHSLPVLALAGALLIGTSALPALAQSKADIANDPASITYSWGVLHSPADGPEVAYPFQRDAAAAPARSQGVARDFVAGPQDITYSWGVIHSPVDGPQVVIRNAAPGSAAVAAEPQEAFGRIVPNPRD